VGFRFVTWWIRRQYAGYLKCFGGVFTKGTNGTNVTKLLYNEIQLDAANARASGPQIESRRLAPSRPPRLTPGWAPTVTIVANGRLRWIRIFSI